MDLILIPAAPFAAAPFIQDNYTNIEIYKDLKKENEQVRKNAIKNMAKER
ncbi:hypothetical protein [Campylobacter sputorum]|nr:hypothetical protein [Campylobacter sputorum]